MALEGRLVQVQEVNPRQRNEMLALMDRYYANVEPGTFDSDLAEKDWVILLVDPESEAVLGFSTQVLVTVPGGDRELLALFSGDTVVQRDYWGRNPLAETWGRFALSLIDAHPAADLYWFLITKGYKTYRFLPVFFHEFYPRYDRPTPTSAAAVLEALSRLKFPDSCDPEAGVVRAGEGGCRLRAGVADLTPERLRDPHVRFFAARNPGHSRGDELCCLAPLTRANFTRAAQRLLGPDLRPEEDSP